MDGGQASPVSGQWFFVQASPEGSFGRLAPCPLARALALVGGGGILLVLVGWEKL
jgi:hypothetical protein